MHNVLIGSSKNKTCMCSVLSATAILQKFTARGLGIANRPINMHIQKHKIHILFFYYYFVSNTTLCCNGKHKKKNCTFFHWNLELATGSPACGWEDLFKIAHFMKI